MSNILVLKNYNIKDHSKWWDDRTKETDLANNYKQMEKICCDSAQKHIKNLDSIKVFRGEADNIRDVFRTNFYEIYDLWKEGHNVLYCDLDVVFVNDVEYFDQTEYFSMFNLTDPTNTTDDFYKLTFENYFNCGIRYYPKNMSQQVWNTGIQMMQNWNPERWDSEQIIYNAMMWQQTTDPYTFYDPVKAYQMLFDPKTGGARNNQFNSIELTDACAVHVHGSRGSANRLEVMSALADGTLVQDTEEYIYL